MSADDKHNEMRSDYHADADVDDDDKLSVNQIMSFFRKKNQTLTISTSDFAHYLHWLLGNSNLG